MKVRLLPCEHGDTRVKDAILRAPLDLGIEFVTVEQNDPKDSSAPYEAAMRTLLNRSVDGVIAGAGIALAEFLPLVFSTFQTSRERNLLFSAAPVEPHNGEPFLLVDPCVVPSPEPEELAAMAVGASRLYSALYARDDPFVAVLSHATGSFRWHNDRRAVAAVEALKKKGTVSFSESILQLDAALSMDAARRKAAPMAKRPNVLVCTEVGVANAIYKTLEVFGRSSANLSGAILTGLSHGLIGLLPRTSTKDEIVRLFSNLARAIRGLPSE